MPHAGTWTTGLLLNTGALIALRRQLQSRLSSLAVASNLLRLEIAHLLLNCLAAVPVGQVADHVHVAAAAADIMDILEAADSQHGTNPVTAQLQGLTISASAEGASATKEGDGLHPAPDSVTHDSQALLQTAVVVLLHNILTLYQTGGCALQLLAALQRAAKLSPGVLAPHLPALAVLGFTAPASDIAALNRLAYNALQASGCTGFEEGVLALGFLQQMALGTNPNTKAWGAHLLAASRQSRAVASDRQQHGSGAMSPAEPAVCTPAHGGFASAPKSTFSLLQAAKTLLDSFWMPDPPLDTSAAASAAGQNQAHRTLREPTTATKSTATEEGSAAAAVRWLRSLKASFRLQQLQSKAAKAEQSSALSGTLPAAKSGGKAEPCPEGLDAVGFMVLAALLAHPSYKVRLAARRRWSIAWPDFPWRC